MPFSGELGRYIRTKNSRYGTSKGGLIAEVCTEGHIVFPPRDICPEQNCGQPAKELVELSGRGKVFSYSKLYSAPEEFQAYLPYVVALIQLQEGPRIIAQLTDLNKGRTRIGMRVEMVTRIISKDGEKGPITYGYKFRPSLPRSR